MAKLAIRGHATHCKEVIEILEMLGGRNTKPYLNGNVVHQVYHIRTCNNEIVSATYTTYGDLFKVFTLEEFLEKFPYKVGDKVTHNMGILMKIVQMYWDAECNVIRYDIQSPVDNNYKLKAMLAEHLQPYKEENMKEKLEQITLDISKGDEFFGINDDNQVVLAKKQPQYPKTYKECCEVIGYESDRQSITGYLVELIEKFQQLLICRDTYWKIGGEPDIQNNECYYLYYDVTDEAILKQEGYLDANAVLTFPTKEMCDAFYKNFKKLINETKELL